MENVKLISTLIENGYLAKHENSKPLDLYGIKLYERAIDFLLYFTDHI